MKKEEVINMSMKIVNAVGIIALMLPGLMYILSLFDSLSNSLTDFIINLVLDDVGFFLLAGFIFIGAYVMVEKLRANEET